MTWLAFSPASYGLIYRRAIARQIVVETSANILWFIILFSLVSVVLIRIIVVTALSYGVGQYAIQMVVRVLVLELIPMAVSVFVGLRSSVPGAAALSETTGTGRETRWRTATLSTIRMEFLSRSVAYVFTVAMLACISCIIALILGYVFLYGFTPWAISPYTRAVGQIFSPVVATIFVCKTLALSLAVSVIPLAGTFYGRSGLSAPAKTAAQLSSLVRLFFIVLVVEVVSLVGNYS